MLPESFQFHMPTRIVAGPGVVENLGAELDLLGVLNLMIVTDNFLRHNGLVDRVLESLNDWGGEVVVIFDQVLPNSELAQVSRGTEWARVNTVDGILAIGGGSVIDTAKGINLLLTYGGDLPSYEGMGNVPGPLKPLTVIPTTAGTGSEVTPFAVIRDNSSKSKIAFTSPHLQPNLAILDPNFTLSLPLGLTASTGIDALTHAIEAYISTMHNPISDAYALHAISLIKESLSIATNHPDDLNARYQMIVASTLAGVAFGTSMVTVVHALAHALGGLYEVPHGYANALFLPAGMYLQLDDVPERLADIARALSVDVSGLSDREAALAGIEAVRNLIAECQLPQRLRDFKVPKEELNELAEKTMADGSILGCVRFPELEEIEALLENIY